jgi:hypothetical protein
MKSLFLIICLLIPPILKAQWDTSIIGSEYESVQSNEKAYYESETNLFSIKIIGKSIVLHSFNKSDMSDHKIKKYDDFPAYYVPEKSIVLNNRYYFLYSWFNPRKKINTLYRREFDIDKAIFLDEGVSVFEFNKSDKEAIRNLGGIYHPHKNLKNNLSLLNISLSVNNKNILIAFSNKSKGKSEDLTLISLNENFEIKGQHLLKIPEKSLNLYSVHSITINNNENISYIKKDETNNDFFLVTISNKGIILNEVKIEIENYYIQEIKLIELKNETLGIIGLYSASKKEVISGYFSVLSNLSGEISQVNTFKFEEEFLTNQNTSNKDIITLENLKIFEIIPTDDNGLLISCQIVEFILDVNSPTISGESFYTGKNQYGQCFHDIILLKLDSDNEQVFNYRIPLLDCGEGNGFNTNSYYLQPNMDGVHFLILRDEKIQNTTVLLNHKKIKQYSNLTVYSYNEKTNTIIQKEIDDSLRKNFSFINYNSINVTMTKSLEIIIEFESKESNMLIKLF